jgi:two-component system LytT family response regulator
VRVLIVDDESPARDKLRRMLRAEEDIAEILEAADGYRALECVATANPDVLFLDVQMPEVNGLEVAASLPAPAPLIVFVTAYDQYAVRAFDANATDYLLKPYDPARLRRAVQRVRERMQQQVTQPASVADDEGNPDREAGPLAIQQPIRQLLINERGVTRVIGVARIDWIETADNYVILHTADEQPLLRQTMASLLEKLGAAFVRCHRRYAVRSERIERVISLDKGDGELLLQGGIRVPYSRQYRAAVLAVLT